MEDFEKKMEGRFRKLLEEYSALALEAVSAPCSDRQKGVPVFLFYTTQRTGIGNLLYEVSRRAMRGEFKVGRYQHCLNLISNVQVSQCTM